MPHMILCSDLLTPVWSGSYPAAAAAAKSLQSCPTLCDPIDVRPHRRKWQPTPVFLPGESQGRGNLVGCHFLLQCMKMKSESEVAQSCPTLRDPVDHTQRSTQFQLQIQLTQVPGQLPVRKRP